MKKRYIIFILFLFVIISFIPKVVYACNTGWQQESGNWVYYNNDCSMKTSEWYSYNDHWYYFDNNGYMVTGIKYIESNGGYYFFSEKNSTIGIMQTGWQRSGDNWYYLESNGKARVNDWLNDGGYWYYLGSDGKVVKGVKKIDDDYYYLSMIDLTYGKMERSRWVEYNGDWYYVQESGKLKKGEWFTSGDNTYYFDSNAKMVSGLKEIDGNTYYFAKKTGNDNSLNNVEVHIKNQTDLNNYLNSTGQNILGDRVYFENTSNIQFPSNGVYYLNIGSDGLAGGDYAAYWYFSSKSKGNIDFNSSTFLIGDKTSLYMHITGDHNNQEIKNGSFYGSVDATYSSGKPYANRGNLNADIIHASNITFKNLQFNNVQEVEDHVLDVMGSDYITFDNITFRGFLNSYSSSQLDNVYYSYGYKEAIQIDVSNSGSSGLPDLDKTPIFNNDLADGVASKYITIKNSYFGPYRGSTGQTIINKGDAVTVRPYGPTIGSHVGSKSGDSYSNITITNNTFTDTFCISNISDKKYLYPIHLMPTLSNYNVSSNTFVNQCGYSGSNGATDSWNTKGFYGRNDSVSSGNTVTTDSNSNQLINTSSIKSKVVTQSYSYGSAQTGFVQDGSYTYYFRKSDNEISNGPKASMIIGLVTIDNHTYLFRETTDSNGPKGSMLKGSGNTKQCMVYNGLNYCADSNGYASVEVTTIDIPTIESSIVYSGSVLVPSITGFDESTMTSSGDLNAINVGNYTVTISLKDTTSTKWSDGTITPKTLNWSVTPKKLAKPSVTNYGGVYDGNSHTITVGSVSIGTIKYSTDNSNWSTTKPTRKDVGTTTVYVKVFGNNNYSDSDTAIGKIIITEKTLISVNIPTVQSQIEYSGSVIVPTITGFNSNTMTSSGDLSAIDAGNYSITFSLKDIDNYMWSDGTTTSKIINWSITPKKLAKPTVSNYSGIYDGSSHTITVSSVSIGTIKYSTDNSNWSTTKPTRKDVGTTTVYVKVFGNNNYSDSDTVTGKIEILQNNVEGYTIKYYNVDNTNRYIGNISPYTTLSNFTSNITLGIGYSVIVDTKLVNGQNVVYTGGKTKIYNNSTLVIQFTNIVNGDTNGDAELDSGDLLRIRQHLLSINPLTGVYIIASDVTKDSIIDSGDLLRIRQHLLGINPIN